MRLPPTVLAFLAIAASAVAADDTAFKSAVDLFDQRHPLEAQQAFETLVAADPQNAQVQAYLGRLALMRHDEETAVTFSEKAAALAPADSRIQYWLGDAYGSSAQKAGIFSKMGLANKCRAAYQKAVALDPKNFDAQFALMNYYLQAPSFVGGGTDKALAQAHAIGELDKSRGKAALISVYVAAKQYDDAFGELDGVLKDTPDDYAALYQTGRLAAMSGQRLDRGLEVLRRCLTLTPPAGQPGPAPVNWRIGNILEKQGDKPGARAAYEAALKLDAKFSPAAESLKKL